MANEKLLATVEVTLALEPDERTEKRVSTLIPQLERGLRDRLKGTGQVEIKIEAVNVVLAG